ncbi:hypothetical protein ACFVJK_14085 [Streptomyces sp. NPDC127172]|uniref:hypothetical protein n=1 Tax=Streptomyces sp. NPDC127172 TaxID=3345382 RepID=UPI003629A7E6
MKIIRGLLNPQRGSVTWGGTSVQGLDRTRLFGRVGQLTQDFRRWPFAAAKNVRIGRPHHPGTPEELGTSVQYATVIPPLRMIAACARFPSTSIMANDQPPTRRRSPCTSSPASDPQIIRSECPGSS